MNEDEIDTIRAKFKYCKEITSYEGKFYYICGCLEILIEQSKKPTKTEVVLKAPSPVVEKFEKAKENREISVKPAKKHKESIGWGKYPLFVQEYRQKLLDFLWINSNISIGDLMAGLSLNSEFEISVRRLLKELVASNQVIKTIQNGNLKLGCRYSHPQHGQKIQIGGTPREVV